MVHLLKESMRGHTLFRISHLLVSTFAISSLVKTPEKETISRGAITKRTKSKKKDQKMKSQKTLMNSKSRRAFQYAKRVALSAPGKLMLAVAVMGSLMSIPLRTGADDRNEHDGNERDRDESRIQQGFAIAPVPLDLRGKNRALVGKGSYIINAQGGCNDCHTWPSFTPGHDPFLGQPLQVNAALYLGGGRPFGPFVSRNITPDEHGLPAGLTRDQFITALRTGIDKDGAILQVMPWPVYGEMTDGDLKAVYEYLRSIPSLSGPGSRDP